MPQALVKQKPVRKVSKSASERPDHPAYWIGREYEHAAEEMALTKFLDGRSFASALDVGGGYGRLSPILKNYAEHVTLISPSEAQLEIARDHLHSHTDIDMKRMPVCSLRFPDASVGLVVMVRMLHKLVDPSAELAEVSRVLRTDGYAVIEIANYARGFNGIRRGRGHKSGISKDIVRHASASSEPSFVNHDPRQIRRQLAHAGLTVERVLSVSNLRSSGIRKIVPHRAVLAIEGVLQPVLARGYFGPSIFFLVRKTKTGDA